MAQIFHCVYFISSSVLRVDLLLVCPAFAQRGGKFSLGSRDSCITAAGCKELPERFTQRAPLAIVQSPAKL